MEAITHIPTKTLSRAARATSAGKVAKQLEAPTKVAEPKVVATTVTEETVKKQRKTNTNTVTWKARNAIAEGKTRDEVWAVLEAAGLPLEKKYYVNWYFAEAKRDGRKTCECK
jgi:hypothetical protein